MANEAEGHRRSMNAPRIQPFVKDEYLIFHGESFFWHLPHYKADITPAEGDIRF
ncbi:hypothetical protein [Paenibacillus graminis]|uniref:hypothetical protein n=1 Tax=Paenibacillus graminis TaxID=189425 RepID=UPI0004B03E83|nr:hypothetical protein [Paenibacillus graminis]